MTIDFGNLCYRFRCSCGAVIRECACPDTGQKEEYLLEAKCRDCYARNAGRVADGAALERQ